MFDLKEFEKEYSYGDLSGLEYLEKTFIKELEEKNKNTMYYTKEDYIIGLYKAVRHLNWCNDIYETTRIKNKFDYNLYFNAKHLLFSEIADYLNIKGGIENE